MGLFADHCGQPEGFGLLLKHRESSGWLAFETRDPYAIVGCAERCSIRLPVDPGGPIRTYVQCVDDRLFVCDMTSADRVHSDWYGLDEEFSIGPYDARVVSRQTDAEVANLRLGHLELEGQAAGQHAEADEGGVRDGRDAVEETPAAELPTVKTARTSGELSLTSDAHQVSAVSVTLRNGPKRGRPLRSNSEVSLMGRRRGCKFRLTSTSVASVHCSLVRTRRSVWVVDLASGRGTEIDGSRVRVAPVRPTSRLAIGRMRLDVNCITDAASEDIVYDDADVDVVSGYEDTSGEHGVEHGLITNRSEADQQLLSEVLAEMGDMQRGVLEQTCTLVSQLVEAQQQSLQAQYQMFASQSEAMQAQNERLTQMIESLAGERPAAAPNVVVNVPPPTVLPQPPPVPAAPIAPPLAAGGPPANTPQEPQQRSDVPPPEAGPEVRDAWVRSRLHDISEQLNSSQRKGLGRLLSKLKSNSAALK